MFDSYHLQEKKTTPTKARFWWHIIPIWNVQVKKLSVWICMMSYYYSIIAMTFLWQNHSWCLINFCKNLFSLKFIHFYSSNVLFPFVIHLNRNNNIAVERLPQQFEIWRSQISVLLSQLPITSKKTVACVKSLIDGVNSSNCRTAIHVP